MPKRRNLNGLPHNLTKSFFGTERYYSCGYMADWLENASRQLGINETTLDIMNGTIEPIELNIRPLTINLADLKIIIQKELKGNGFPLDFITEAKIKIQFLNQNTSNRTMHCFPTIKDKEGYKYESGEIIEEALEEVFDVFDEKNICPVKNTKTFFEKVKSLVYTNKLNKQSSS